MNESLESNKTKAHMWTAGANSPPPILTVNPKTKSVCFDFISFNITTISTLKNDFRSIDFALQKCWNISVAGCRLKIWGKFNLHT